MKKVAGYIKRKSMLYKTDVEYGDYTMNHIQGCAHGCRYPCYAYLMARRFGKVKDLDEWQAPYLVENTLELLKKELPRLREKIKSVHLCFTTDPFMYGYSEIAAMSVSAIKVINNAGLSCTVLTKGHLPLTLASLSHDNAYGITLITLDEGFRKQVEPNAAPIRRRITALRNLASISRTSPNCSRRFHLLIKSSLGGRTTTRRSPSILNTRSFIMVRLRLLWTFAESVVLHIISRKGQ